MKFKITAFCVHVLLYNNILCSSGSFSVRRVGLLDINSVGFGTWQWGNKFLWDYKESNDENLRKTFSFLNQRQSSWFDSAEVYGEDHRSESLIGKFSRESTSSPIVFSKFAPNVFRIGKESVIEAATASASRLGKSKIDLYQLHWPPTPLLWQEEAYLTGMCDLVKQEKVAQLGVSNYGVNGLRRAHKTVSENGGRLYTNQIQTSLLAQSMLQSGIVETCDELGIVPISYSPLALGLLADKYTLENLPSGFLRATLFREFLPGIEPLLRVLRDIASQREKTVAQVVLNWNLCKGFIVLVGTRSVAQAIDSLGAADFRLSEGEITEIEKAAAKVKQFIKNPQEGD